MSKKFDSTIVGAAYSRVMSFSLRYTAERTAVVKVSVQEHVKLDDGRHVPIGSEQELSFNILPEDFQNDFIELREVSTGQLLGQTMALGHLFIGVASLIRQHELLVLNPVQVTESPE